MSELYLTGVLMYAGDIPLHEGGQLRVLPGVVVDMKREDLAAAPSLPMYQQVAVVPVAEIAELRAEIASVTAELQSAKDWILNDSKTIGQLRADLARVTAQRDDCGTALSREIQKADSITYDLTALRARVAELEPLATAVLAWYRSKSPLNAAPEWPAVLASLTRHRAKQEVGT